MRRRTIIIGSGCLFTTALAGCMSGGDADGDPDDTNGDDDGGAENGTSDDGTGDDGTGDDGTGDGSNGEERDDVPGFDDRKIDGDELTIKRITHDDGRVKLDVEATVSRKEEAYDHLPAFSDRVHDAVTDPEKLFANVSIVEVTIYSKDGQRVMELYIDIDWIREWLQGDLTAEEFVEKMADSAE